jgi:hypothetical protein
MYLIIMHLSSRLLTAARRAQWVPRLSIKRPGGRNRLRDRTTAATLTGSKKVSNAAIAAARS